MKNLVVVLPLVIMLVSLLTACSNQSVTQSRSVYSDLSNGQFVDDLEVDSSVMENFVTAINNHQVQIALDLFNDGAVVTEVSQIGLGTTLPQNGGNSTLSTKGEIESWLKSEIASNLEITPVEYNAIGKTGTLKSDFNFPDQLVEVRLVAYTQGGRFNSLYYYMERVKLFYPNGTT
jgi:hypothetical protein